MPKIQIPKIPEEEETPIVSQLLEIVEQLSVTALLQAEEIQLLKDEIARLKGQKPKPKIRPSKLEKDRKEKEKSSSGKRPGSKKREKTANLVIHNEIPVPPESIPPGSIFKEYQPYTVQGIRILPYNVRYLLERWQMPDGRNIVGKLPSHVQSHYDFELKTYILYQYNHCQVTQPLLLEQLWEWGVDISAGQLNRILTEDKNIFHNEKDEILSTGLKVSDYVNVDDTG
ncbi:MAG: transposase, partial [Desulfobacterales bacterium]|nr:transposase [Desulfobacterales bacterium]